MLKIAFTLFLALTGTAALAQRPLATPEDVAQAVQVKSDRFSNTVSIVLPTQNLSTNDVESMGVGIIAVFEPSRPDLVVAQVNTYITYSGRWRFYDRVLYVGGRVASTSQPTRDVISCAGRPSGQCLLMETVGAYLDLPMFFSEETRRNGLEFRVQGRGYYTDVNIPPHMIEGFHRRLQEALAASNAP